MKTRYLAEAELNLLNPTSTGGLANPIFVDLFNGSIYAGLLSSLPITGKDGWQGASELFSPPTASTYLQGVKDPFTQTGSYYPVQLNKSLFSIPSPVNTPIGVSGIASEYQGPIEFPVASLAWGNVVGIVFYIVSSNVARITPLFTAAFVSPVTVGVDDKLTILNSSSTRVRAIELIKKNTL